jgi:hypothetical protein
MPYAWFGKLSQLYLFLAHLSNVDVRSFEFSPKIVGDFGVCSVMARGCSMVAIG